MDVRPQALSGNPLARHFTFFVSGLFAFALVVGGVYGYVHFSSYNVARPLTTPIARVHNIDANDHVLGSVSAPVQLIVFYNPDCSYCKDLHDNVMPRLLAEFGSKIAVAFRYIYIPLFPNSKPEMSAIECAYITGGNDKYWRLQNDIYAASPPNSGLAPKILDAILAKTRIDMVAYNACMQKGTGAARVNKDLAEAANAGMVYTPTVIVRGPQQSLVIPSDNYAQLHAAISFLLTP